MPITPLPPGAPLRILCATDFSPGAAAATARAARLARDGAGALELVHVMAPREAAPYRMPGCEAETHDIAATLAKLRTAALAAQATYAVPVAFRLTFGTVHAEIAARAQAIGASVVVVGPHAPRAVRDMFAGAAAQQLARTLRVPLLVARGRAVRRCERVLVATDLSGASAQAAHAAARLFPGAALHFLHVRNALFANRVALGDGRADAIRVYRNQALLHAGRELDTFIRGHGLQHRRASSVVRSGYPPACIAEAASELGTSVVAFGVAGRSHLDATLYGSVSAAFTGGRGHDVLLVRAARSPRRELVDADAGMLPTT